MRQILAFYANFWINPVQNFSVQIQKVKDQKFDFQLKNHVGIMLALTDDARLKNVPSPSFDLSRILRSFLKRNDRSKFLQK